MARTSSLLILCSAAATVSLLGALGASGGCSSSYSVPENATGSDAGGSSGGGGDGGSMQTGNDGGGSGVDASQGPIVWPDNFPAHFPGVRPAAALTDLGPICAIDTTALTYTPCNGGAPKTTPNFYQLPMSQSVAAFFFDRVAFTNPVKVTGARGLVIVVAHDASVTGRLDASANLTASGPGADALAPMLGTGAGKSADQGGNDNGGGGGGHGTAGANGAFSTAGNVTTNRGAGGLAFGSATALYGGARGGGGNIITQGVCGEGGGAGGALQISAVGNISITGQVLAGGGGGSGGCYAAGAGHGGAGGGAGGTIYLESRATIDVVGTVAANGGGGGAGANGAMGAPGQNGQASSSFAYGGPGGGLGGAGGTGGMKDPPTTPAGGMNAGGGGGAAGAIYLSPPPPVTSMNGTISPPASM